MLNEAPNNNDATRVVNNVHLTTMVTLQFSMATIQPASYRKVNSLEMRDNDVKTIKVRADGNMLRPGKEWGLYMPGSKDLGGRLFSVTRQAVRQIFVI